MKKVIFLMVFAVFGFCGNFESGFKQLINGDQNGAIEFFKKSCEIDKDRTGCFLLANTIEKTDTDLKVALMAYEKSCDMGDMDGCYEVGKFYAGHKSYDLIDDKKSVFYFNKACLAAMGSACSFAGEYYELADVVDLAKAEEYYKMGCKYKDGYSCYALANLYDEKKLSGLNEATLMRYYGLGCDYNDDISCRKFRDKFKLIYKENQ